MAFNLMTLKVVMVICFWVWCKQHGDSYEHFLPHPHMTISFKYVSRCAIDKVCEFCEWSAFTNITNYKHLCAYIHGIVIK